MEEAQRPNERNRELSPNMPESHNDVIAEFCDEYLNQEDQSQDFWLEFQNNLHSLLEKLWNEDLAKIVDSAEKELAELQDFQKKQHEELVKYRRELEQDQIKEEQQKTWAESAAALLDKANVAFASLQQKSEQLSQEQSGYLEKRNKLVDFNQEISSRLEFAMHKMNEQKEQSDKELQKLRERVKQEQEITDTLIKENECDLHASLEILIKEFEQADNECKGIETDLEVAIQRQQKINECLKSVNEQLEEEESYKYEEMDHSISEMKTETDRNEAFINAELIKEQNLQYVLEQKSRECDVETSNYKRLQEENSELQQRWERELVKRQQSQKDLERTIKELLVLKTQSKAMRDQQCKENADMEHQVQDNTMKIDSTLKCLNEKDTSIYLLEEENTRMQQKRNRLIEELAQAKNNLVENENSLLSLSFTLENLRKEVEDRDNVIGQEMLLRKERLEMVAVKTEQMDYILNEMDNKEKQLKMEQHLLCDEWETLNQQVKHPRNKILESEIENSDELKIDNTKSSELKDQQQLTLEQIEVLNEKCLKAEERKNDLLRQIRLQESALEKHMNEKKCLPQEIENVETSIHHVQEETTVAEKRIQERKGNLSGKVDVYAHSSERIKQLDSEIEDLENKLKAYQTAGSEENQEDTADYESQVQHICENLSLENDKKNNLEETCNEIARKLKEVVSSGEEKLKNTEKEIDALEKGLNEQKEFIEISNNKMSQWIKPIAGNEKKCAEKSDQLEEGKNRVSALKDKMSALKKELDGFLEETKEGETHLAAELETLTNELEQMKKNASETKRLKEAERTTLVNELKKAQSYLRELVSVPSSSLGEAEAKQEPNRNTTGGDGPIAQVAKSGKSTPLRTEIFHTQPSTGTPVSIRPDIDTCDSGGSSSSSSIVLTKEDRQQMLREPSKAFKLIAELRQKKRLKRASNSQ